MIKCNDHSRKFLTYIGEFNDGKDVIIVLKNYYNNLKLPVNGPDGDSNQFFITSKFNLLNFTGPKR